MDATVICINQTKKHVQVEPRIAASAITDLATRDDLPFVTLPVHSGGIEFDRGVLATAANVSQQSVL